ncbi:MAG: adenylate/guanylate cyclase domain-containing protein [Euzebya sp.]
MGDGIIGVGVNTGPAVVGNIGGHRRVFTAIGDTVNLAARLDGIASAQTATPEHRGLCPSHRAR